MDQLPCKRGKPSETVTGDIDRISELPELIVHNILSFLKTSYLELVRMSVLSKTWFYLTASFPVLLFCNESFRSRESFFKYVNYATTRFCLHNVTAHKFNLRAILQEPAESDVVNKCLELVLKNGVRELDFRITNSSESSAKSMPKYRLPNTLLSVSVLNSLTIRGCELPSSLLTDVVKLKSLVRLRLEDVHITDEAINHITTSCPLLQELGIISCHGFRNVCVKGHRNLKKVKLGYTNLVERIDIEAPNLSNLLVFNTRKSGVPQMNLTSCEKLTTVAYKGIALQDSNGFTNFLSNFPFIKNLIFLTKYKNKNLELSSHSLRTLVLHSQCDLEDIYFNTPNLVLFIYSCNNQLLRPFLMDIMGKRLVRRSSHLKTCMQCYPDDCMDANWFNKLRLFLDKKKGFKAMNLYISAIYSQNMIELEKLKEIELPPYELEHVELQLNNDEESPDHVRFVDAVLRCCCPRFLTLRSSSPFVDFEEQSDLVKFTCEKLLQQKNEGHAHIQIVSPFSYKAQKHSSGLMSFPVTLSCEGKLKSISFIKEEEGTPN